MIIHNYKEITDESRSFVMAKVFCKKAVTFFSSKN